MTGLGQTELAGAEPGLHISPRASASSATPAPKHTGSSLWLLIAWSRPGCPEALLTFCGSAVRRGQSNHRGEMAGMGASLRGYIWEGLEARRNDLLPGPQFHTAPTKMEELMVPQTILDIEKA